MKTKILLIAIITTSASLLVAQQPQLPFIPYVNNPVLEKGEPGSWDEGHLLWSFMFVEDNTYYLYYSSSTDIWNDPCSIGLAISTDGYEFEKVVGPIFEPDGTGFDAYSVSFSVVIKYNEDYILYYSGQPNPGSALGTSIGQAVADNPKGPFVPAEDPILQAGSSGEWDSESITPESVIVTDSGLIMFYSGFGDNLPARVGLAHLDGDTWIKYNDPQTGYPYAESDPILELGDPGEWDDDLAALCSVYKTVTGFEMFYSGSTDNSMNIGYATSENGIEWFKHPNNPIYSYLDDPFAVLNGYHVVANPTIMIKDSLYYMYYDYGLLGTDISLAIAYLAQILIPPQNLAIQITGNDVTLSWEAPSTEEVLGYNVYRDGLIIAEEITELSYTDPGLPDGSYWYAITALYPEGESVLSEPVQATIGGFIGKVQGFVRDATTRLNIESAWVSAQDSDFGAVTYYTPFGSHYTLSLPGGIYNITCEAEHYQPQTIFDFEILDGQTRSKTFYLQPEGMIFTEMDREENVHSTGIYPNPFQASTTITYSLNDDSYIWLKIQKACGQELITLVDEFQEKGIYQVVFDGSELEPGIYFCVLKTNNGVQTIKMIKL